ncbi:MAG: copper chaperone PCu(A)C [Nitratireductor sp.]
MAQLGRDRHEQSTAGRKGPRSLSIFVSLAMKVAGVLTAGLLSTAVQAHEFSRGDIRIDHPWSRITPSVAPVAGAYLTVINSGTEADRLTGGSTPIAERIEIHRMTMENGIARMRPLPDGVEIAPGASVELAPGGIHLMLIKPSRQLVEGDRFKARLDFAKGGAVDVEFVVQKNASAETGSGAEHGGHAP